MGSGTGNFRGTWLIVRGGLTLFRFFYQLQKGGYFLFGGSPGSLHYTFGIVLSQKPLNGEKLKGAVHDLETGGSLVATSTVLKGDVVSQSSAVQLNGIVLVQNRLRPVLRVSPNR